MKRLDSITGSIREYTSIFDAFGVGATPEDIKQKVIQLFTPYFENQDVLEEMAVNLLMPNAIEFERIRREIWVLKLFEHTLDIYHQAKSVNSNDCLKACSDWIPATYQGLSTFWSQYNLEQDTTDFELEEFVLETLRTVGAFVEGLIKPVVKAILHQVKIKCGEAASYQAIQDTDLGVVINELIQKANYQSFFELSPHSVRINQWRNIAQHFSTRIEGQKIICWYGRPPRITEFELTREELFEVAVKLSIIYSSLRLSQQIFFVDNLYEIKSSGLLPSDVKIRPETFLVNLTSGLASQGFELIDFQDDNDEILAIVQDVTKLDPDERRFHTIQFTPLIWAYTRSKQIVIEYRESDGKPNFRVRAVGELCRKVCEGEMKPATFGGKVVLTDLKTNLIIPPLP